MTTLLNSDLIERCHQGSRNKGFWDVIPDQRQQLMLMIGELAEAQEAHRKGKVAKPEDVSMVQKMAAGTWHLPTSTFDFPWFFERAVKDTPPDELADAFIRGCDFAGGFGHAQEAVDGYYSARYNHTENAAHIQAVPGNFGAALFEITSLLTELWALGKADGYRLGQALAAIERLSDREGIDLATHIDLKLRYNATRPAKHGKAY